MSLRSQGSSAPPSRAPPGSDSGYSGLSAYAKSSTAYAGGNPSSSAPAVPSRNDSIGQSSARSNGPSASASSGGPPKPPPISVEQSRAIARTHFDQLKSWLQRENALGNGSTRGNARDKLTRLTRQQFQELSTDVYDELVRRLDEEVERRGEQPFLPVRGEFHPKRNQARQKLATLPLGRFRDLASDVYFELERRYPEFGEEEAQARPAPSPSAYSPPMPRSTSNPNNMDSNEARENTHTKQAPSHSSSSNSISRRNLMGTGGGGGGGVTNDIVVPNKSTLVMEEPALGGGGAGMGGYERDGRGGSGDAEEYAQEDGRERAGERRDTRASEASSIGTKFIGGYAAGSEGGGVRRSWDGEELEKVKSDYEYKVTMLQNRVAELQRENMDARDALKNRQADANRTRDLETQVREHRERYEDQSSALLKLRTDFDALQKSRSRDVSNADTSSRLRQDLDRLTRERDGADELANELRGEVGSLVDELRSVNARCEEALEARERDAAERKAMEEEEEEEEEVAAARFRLVAASTARVLPGRREAEEGGMSRARV